MPSNLSKEQFWKLYEGLPQELKDALFAPETGDYIEETCARNAIENNTGAVVELVGRVLLGLVSPEDFQSVLEKETKIKKDVAKNVSREINRFIFYPAKESLAGLHKIETGPTNGIPAGITPPVKPVAKNTEGQTPIVSPTPTLKKQDLYKEEIE